MDPKIAARFNESMLSVALQRYGVETGQAHKLDGFESFIYRFERPDGKFILRIGHSGRRSAALIHGEVDWINHLAANNVRVARAIPSLRNELVEPIPDGVDGEFLCTAFVHAPGGPARGDSFNEKTFRNYGRLLGQMHRLARAYRVSNPAWRRHEWDSPENNTAESHMPARERLALEKYRAVSAHLQSLPRVPEGYGMIHQDAHPGNFFVTEDFDLTLFDFDDCVYGHFIYDIAMVLFYTAVNEKDSAEFTGRFMPIFFSGYREENQLDPAWLEQLPHFMKLREIDLFAVIHFSFEDGDNPDNPWCARYMQGRRARIENDVPFIEFDWKSLAKYL